MSGTSGPEEKDQFLSYLHSRLRDKRLQALVKNLFRPSYGGNRNFTLMYTLGGLMISSDDDMRPFALLENSPESLGAEEVSRGRFHKAGVNGYSKKSFDIMAAFLDVLSKPASDVPENYERGEILIDTSTELETNATKVFSPGELASSSTRSSRRRCHRQDRPNLSHRHE